MIRKNGNIPSLFKNKQKCIGIGSASIVSWTNDKQRFVAYLRWEETEKFQVLLRKDLAHAGEEVPRFKGSKMRRELGEVCGLFV